MSDLAPASDAVARLVRRLCVLRARAKAEGRHEMTHERRCARLVLQGVLTLGEAQNALAVIHAAIKGEVGAPKACSSHAGVAVLLVHGVRLAGNGDGALLVLEALEGECPRAQVPKQQRSHQPHIGTHFLRHLRERIVGRCEDRHPGRRVSKQLLAQTRKRERIAKGDEAQAAHALLSRVLGWGRGMSTVCEL
jgi:hypothetical protein